MWVSIVLELYKIIFRAWVERPEFKNQSGEDNKRNWGTHMQPNHNTSRITHAWYRWHNQMAWGIPIPLNYFHPYWWFQYCRIHYVYHYHSDPQCWYQCLPQLLLERPQHIKGPLCWRFFLSGISILGCDWRWYQVPQMSSQNILMSCWLCQTHFQIHSHKRRHPC